MTEQINTRVQLLTTLRRRALGLGFDSPYYGSMLRRFVLRRSVLQSFLTALALLALILGVDACARRTSKPPPCLRSVGALCLIERIPGMSKGGELGFRFTSPRDVNGDGIADIAAGARFTRFPDSPSSQTGTASVWSGKRRGRLLHWNGNTRDGLFGHAVALMPDLDGDRHADLIVAGPTGNLPASTSSVSATQGVIWARSVHRGTILWSQSGGPGDSFGWDLAPTHDHDQDGIADLFVGAPGAVTGLVHLLSGRDGAIIHTYKSNHERDGFGWYVSTVPDIDGDQRDDLAVGAPFWMRVEDGRRDELVGRALVLSSATGRELHQWRGDLPAAQFGEIVCGLPDIDDDGTPDIAISATYTRAKSGPLAGEVFVYSGATGEVVRHFAGRQERELYGRMIAPAGDFDGDGIEDLAIGAPWYRAGPSVRPLERAGRLEIRSGASGTILAELTGDEPNRWLGWHIVAGENLGPKRERGLLISLLRSREDDLLGAGALELYTYRQPEN